MLNQLQTNQKVLYDLVVHYLEPVSSLYGRLAYLAGLRDPITGIYAHERLAAVYGEEPVRQAVEKSHEEIFERLLELPLEQQEEDLWSYVSSLPGESAWGNSQCVEAARGWIPPQAPDYLKELFCSNTTALCELLQSKSPRH